MVLVTGNKDLVKAWMVLVTGNKDLVKGVDGTSNGKQRPRERRGWY